MLLYSTLWLILQVKQAFQLQGHTGPIMALSDHPDEKWVSNRRHDILP
jgi:hypothetical protein